MKHRALLPILVFGLCGSLQVSLAESFTFTKIEMPGGADLTISASGINNVGQSVGSVIDTHAFPQGVPLRSWFLRSSEQGKILGMPVNRHL